MDSGVNKYFFILFYNQLTFWNMHHRRADFVITRERQNDEAQMKPQYEYITCSANKYEFRTLVASVSHFSMTL